jgi:hypothetical protein
MYVYGAVRCNAKRETKNIKEKKTVRCILTAFSPERDMHAYMHWENIRQGRAGL